MSLKTHTKVTVMKRRKNPSQFNTERPKGSYLEAATTILKRAKEPLTVKEITERAIASTLLQSIGKTPERSMAARLYLDVLHNPASRFRRIAPAGPTRGVPNAVKWALR